MNARRVAAQAGGNPVKQLGEMMVDDHSKANAERCRGDGSWDEAPTDMEADAQAALGQMNLAKGADLDRIYVNAMVEDHKDVEAFKKEADSGQTGDQGVGEPDVADVAASSADGGGFAGVVESG